MGVLRIYLAACVVAAHSEKIFPWPVHGGESAVGIFFVISGFYMQLILSGDRYTSKRSFFMMRALRIYIPYMVCLAFCVLAGAVSWLYCENGLSAHRLITNLAAGNVNSIADYGVILSNITVFFQDTVMFMDRDIDGNLRLAGRGSIEAAVFYPYLVIPQAWSIAVELQFYLLSPWLVRRLSNRQLVGLILFCSVLRFAGVTIGDLSFDPWTYRFALFELPKFVAGILGCRLLWQNTKARSIFEYLCAWAGKMPFCLGYPVCAVLVLLLMRLHLGTCGLINRLAASDGPSLKGIPEMFSLLLSAAIVPVCFCLTRLFPVDRKVGELSFPVYLLHLTIVLAFTGPLNFLLPSTAVLGESAIVITIALALLFQIALLDRLEVRRQSRVLSVDTIRL